MPVENAGPDAHDMTAMLDGITVLDLSSVGPAARAGRMLADYGADVVKVGPVPKVARSDDGSRAEPVQIVPPFYAYSGHRGMRRVLLDLKSEAGREAFLRLAAAADVVIESFRPGVVDRLGIGYEATRAVNPGIVYCSTTGYGQDGPYAQWAGHDVDYLALGGFLHCSERGPDGKPPLPGATVADSAGGGMHAVMAILAALVHRDRSDDRMGAHLDVAVVDGVLSMMSLYVDEYLAAGTEPGPGHYILTGRYACYDTYRCADDRWVAVGAIEPAFWRNLCRRLDCEQWSDHQMDDDCQDQVRADLAAAFRRRTRDEWVAELASADTCVAPVYSVPELVVDPQLAARNTIVDAEHPAAGTFRQLGPLLAGTDRSVTRYEVRDAAVTDTDALLAAVGYDAPTVSRLRRDGVVA